MQPPVPLCFWFFPCLVLGYCKWLGPTGGQRESPGTELGLLSTLLSHQEKTPRECYTPGTEELGVCEGVCLPTHVRVKGGVGHGRGACPLQFDLSSSLRSQDLGRRRERQTGGRGEGSKNNSRRTSSVQYGRLSHYYYNIL